jgi:L-iditol 2-dehydrogenase
MVVKDVKTPECTRDSILLKVEAAALCGTDIRVFSGSKPIKKLPQIIGHEIAGTAVEVGSAIKDVKKGDRLAIVPSNPCGECKICKQGLPPDLCPNHRPIGFVYPGGFAEYILIPPSAVRVGAYVKIPDGIDFNEAAIAEPFGCVIHGQDMLDVHSGDTVVVIGAGPIGCMHLEVAKTRGVKKRILIQRSENRLKLAKQLKFADFYINTTMEDPIKRVLEYTDGDGVDVVITAVSSAEAHELALEISGVRGRINLFGGLPKDNPYVHFDSNKVHYKELTVLGSAGTGSAEMRVALDLMVQGKINPGCFITHELPLDDILKGMEIVRSGQGLKVIIRP